jgi:hypothetical protein
MKREAKILDGTSDKRLFWSIIQDYDLKTSICELTDNALDLYLRSKQTTPVFIKIDLDVDRQLIRIEDNAGGVREALSLSPSEPLLLRFRSYGHPLHLTMKSLCDVICQ